MSALTSIQWTDRTWNPVRGCSIVSRGCHNCYAMKQAHRFSGVGKPYHGLTKRTASGPQWTGKIRTVESALLEPLSWRKPQRVFVNSMSDLFHEQVPDDFIDLVFAVMALANQHTFQVLTKRADRMRQYLIHEDVRQRVSELVMLYDFTKDFNSDYEFDARDAGDHVRFWPLLNVHLLVSCEDQPAADARIPALLRTPAAVRGVSLEPLLGPIDLTQLTEQAGDSYGDGAVYVNSLDRSRWMRDGFEKELTPAPARLDWLIAGCESNGRPGDLEWLRGIVKQGASAGVACFVKQTGSASFDSSEPPSGEFMSFGQWVNKARSWLGGISGAGLKYKRPERAVCVDARGRICARGGDFARARDEGAFPVRFFLMRDQADHHGGDPSEWPADLQVRQFPGRELE
jgi:protein gp37